MSYPDAFPRDSFTVHVSITHDPTGLKFLQQGGRILVLKAGIDGIYRTLDDFTFFELQEFGKTLTQSQLIRVAIDWLKGHPQ